MKSQIFEIIKERDHLSSVNFQGYSNKKAVIFFKICFEFTVNQLLFVCDKFLRGSRGHHRRKYLSPRTIRCRLL